MARRDDRYVQAIDGKKIPILTLDQKWHRLFTQTGVSAEIKRKEEKVNELLKKQGGLQTRQKDIKRLKNKLMQEVLSSMEGEEKPKGRSREENGKLIEECNMHPTTVGLIVNRAPKGELNPGVVEEIENQGLKLLGVVPQDDAVYEYDCEGRPTASLPEDNPVKQALRKIVDNLEL